MMHFRGKNPKPKPPHHRLGCVTYFAWHLAHKCVDVAVQAYPNKQDLAKAIKGRLKSSSGKKKMSRLKRLIVREKTDNAAEAAAQNSEAAAAAASKAQAAHASVSQSLQVPHL